MFKKVAATVGSAVALAAVATPAPALAVDVRSCTVPQWSCATGSVHTTGSLHVATQWLAANESRFIIVRDQSGAESVRFTGYGNLDAWGSVSPGTYTAELHCPYDCAGAVLHLGNG